MSIPPSFFFTGMLIFFWYRIIYKMTYKLKHILTLNMVNQV
jgi:hypothetical protein